METIVSAERGQAATAAGWMDWSVKDSFLRYVKGLPDGVCDVSPDIGLVGGGVFRFPLTAIDLAPETSWRFGGFLRFTGHGGFLEVVIAEPALEESDGHYRFTSADRDRRICIADAEPVESADSRTRFALRLTTDGALLFGGVYSAGEPLSDLVMTTTEHPTTSQRA
ncbi:HtaA domain-containing protein [Microbacterium thalassium]|uniref:Htaa domain-containing protein n=1 Tax=Microbacterium thalassium TaxID=362649 RepID=A0A7X0FP29_9MICO|nr:HtaA domain-containing protein [Microbacterium thalassium]MBB6390506.1 hypothetical protein [Microbacterium thalassium]GLK25617.1 hypothetical protein GCM10017607_29360 [Microbacterium thalassium]